MRKLIALALAVILCFTLLAACGETKGDGEVKFPESGTLTIIVPVSAGAGMDVDTRIVAKHLAKELSINVVVENIAGGASVVASTQYLSLPKNSDYIINLSTDHTVLSPVLQDATYSHNDFEPLIAAKYSEEYFWVPADSPWNTWDDVIAASKSKDIIFGTGAKTGPVYIATKSACDISDVNMQVVIANSIPESIANMLGGHVQITWSSFVTAEDYYKAGKIKPIVGTGIAKNTDEANVETLKELGYDFNFSSCNLFLIRKDTDAEKIKIIKEALEKVYASPDFQAEWVKAGQTVLEDFSADFAKDAIQQKVQLIPDILKLMGK